MVKIPDFFSLKHLLALSLALNVSLVLRVLFESENQGLHYYGLALQKKFRGTSMAESGSVQKVAHVSKRAVLSTPFSSSSSSVGTLSEVEDGGEKIINLDQ